MKKFLFSALCLLAFFASLPQLARAQDADSGPHTRNWPTPEEVVAKMDSQLSLSDDQKAKITPIIAERQEKLKALVDSSGRRRKKGREARSIISDSDKKIEALLNDDQRKKYEEMEQQRREEARERHAQRRSGSSD